jgi:hypothetical protein
MLGRRHVLQTGVGATLASVSAPVWAMAQEAGAGQAVTATDDVILVRQLLEALHPGLYRYQSPRQFDRAHRRFASEWAGDDRLEMRYLALSRLLSQIRCGHSYANFFNQSGIVASALFEGPTRLPFAFRWIGDAMVVTANHSGAGNRTPVTLPVGTIIEAVDGVPVRHILERLLPYARVDGHNAGKARALMSVTGADTIEFFDVFHGLLFGAPAGGLFDVVYRPPGGGNSVRASMPALTLAERRSQMAPESNDPNAVQWQWSERPDGVTVLTMDGWGLYNSRWDWRSWLIERLDSLNAASKLIIDLRQNEGGIDCGDLILARLTDRPLPRRSGRRLVRYRSVPAALRPFLDTWDRSFFDWVDDAQPVDSRYFLLRDDQGNDAIEPHGRRLPNLPIVLTSAQNSSATFQFAQQIKRHRLGRLVGEATGGNQRGINGGAFFFARLPQSGIEFDIPLIGFFPDQAMPDAGIEPDVMVMPSAEDIAAGRDPVLDRAVRLLAG